MGFEVVILRHSKSTRCALAPGMQLAHPVIIRKPTRVCEGERGGRVLFVSSMPDVQPQPRVFIAGTRHYRSGPRLTLQVNVVFRES